MKPRDAAKLPVSVFAHVQNEEAVLEECLRSVSWADEIFVVDSFSGDRTKEIARRHTPNVVDHAYVNSADQKNWCLDNLPFRNEWVFLIDADERVPVDLAAEIASAVKAPAFDGYYVPRRNWFMGREIRHVWGDSRELRLFKHRLGRWDGRAVHSELVLQGRVGTLRSKLDHPARESITQYIQKLNRHTTWEAEELAAGRGFLNTSDIPRPAWRRFLRRLWPHLPGKPLLMFLYLYVGKQGFRDGYPGFLISVFQSFYVFLSHAKFREKTLAPEP